MSIDLPSGDEILLYGTAAKVIKTYSVGDIEYLRACIGDAGALTKYFGKVVDADDFKLRGIEARQRSTPPFIEDVQRDCLEQFDATRSPDAVLDRLQDAITRLHAGTVPVEHLVERNRVSKPLEGYTQNTQNVAALYPCSRHPVLICFDQPDRGPSRREENPNLDFD